jgi:hypothetical protein
VTDTIVAGHYQPLTVWVLSLYCMGLNGSNDQSAPLWCAATSAGDVLRVRDLRCDKACKPRQHLCYVYASLSRLDFRGLPEKSLVVFEGVIGFATIKKPTTLMMHW